MFYSYTYRISGKDADYNNLSNNSNNKKKNKKNNKNNSENNDENVNCNKNYTSMNGIFYFFSYGNIFFEFWLAIVPSTSIRHVQCLGV